MPDQLPDPSLRKPQKGTAMAKQEGDAYPDPSRIPS